MRPGGVGIRRMIDRAVTLLPEPDSPTMPRVSPLLMCRSMPSTARTTPSSVKKCVFKPLTSSSRSAIRVSFTRARALPPGGDLAERVQRTLDVVAVDVLVGHAADRGGADSVNLDLARRAPLHELLDAARPVDVEDHDVGLDAGQI